jgi:hypothetical protein
MKNLVLHSSKCGTMQIDSLTKLGKISYAEELTCITDVISVEQSLSTVNIFALYMWHGKMLPEVL